MADPLELELKLDFDAADRKKLDSTALLKSVKGKSQRLISTYFDTPAEDLRKTGYSLRVRRQGRQRIQTVKAAGGPFAGLFARGEWEQAIQGDAPLLDEAIGPLIQAVGAAKLDRIKPIFVTDVRRTVFRIDQADARVEIAVDVGEVRAGGRVEPICEIEFELSRGSQRALFDCARQLNEQVPLRLGVRSKSERGYALAAGDAPEAVKAEPIALDLDGEAGDAFAAIAQSCIRHFRINEDLLMRSGAAESLHQARVGLRRLRSAFSLHDSLLADGGATELLRAELRWLAAELGEVRNIDVLVVRCTGEARDRLTAARARTFARVRAEIASSRTRLLMIDLAEWVAVGAWRTNPVDPVRLRQGVMPFAAELLESRRKRLKRRGKGLAGLDDAHRHKVRIEAKKLRYATEFFASLYTTGKTRRRHKRFLDKMEALQDLLGELNDLVVGPAVLESLGIDASLLKVGKHKHKRLLAKAGDAFDALVEVKPYWRPSGRNRCLPGTGRN